MILAHNTPIVNKYVNSVSVKLSFYSYTYSALHNSLYTIKKQMFSINLYKDIIKLWFNDFIYNDKCSAYDHK